MNKGIAIKPIQSRQVERKQQRDQFKQNTAQAKILNSPVVRKEILPWINRITSLQQHIENQELVIASLQNVLLKKNVITKEDLEEAQQFEQNKYSQFKLIQSSDGEFVERLDICKKYDIPIERTVIPSQIKANTEMDEEAKLNLIKEYSISKELIFDEIQNDKK